VAKPLLVAKRHRRRTPPTAIGCHQRPRLHLAANRTELLTADPAKSEGASWSAPWSGRDPAESHRMANQLSGTIRRTGRVDTPSMQGEQLGAGPPRRIRDRAQRRS